MDTTAGTPPDFRHDQPERTGVLLVNLGTPDSPSTRDVRRYLAEFLWDPRVVEVPRPIWWLVLNGVILNTRPRRSAAAYAKIWTDQGSPLLVISRQQQAALQARLGDDVPVALGMRYGKPTIDSAFDELAARGARRVLILPLYPQYSATTTASIFDAVAASMRRRRWLPELRFVNHYHDHSDYIAALAASVREFQQHHGTPDVLLMSFHGIPREYFDKGDPYHCECQKTGRLLADALGLSEDQWRLSFQSRLGPKEWLRPYTDETLKALPADGTRDVQVVCPGFAADCLETLEEIALENRQTFLDAGGASYQYIPCLNDRQDHVAALAALVEQHCQGWEAPSDVTQLAERLARAKALGATG